MSTIEVKNVGKRFRLKHEKERSFKSTLLNVFKRQTLQEDFWALRNISFEVNSGETLGIIGANGAGKSTFLGLAAQTIRPTEGTVKVEGRVSGLLELGAGFHPELNGKENVFLNGSILGLSKRQIEERYDRIVQFAELAPFMDVPVKHYSSGMYVRLGFAVAVEVDPDVLLIDEVLAVGDETFRKKCLQKIHDFKTAGKTMLIVSHDLDIVKQISDRILLLDQGKLIELGKPQTVIDDYLRLGIRKFREPLLKKDWGTLEAEIKNVVFLDTNNKPQERFRNREKLTMEIHYQTTKRIDYPVFGFSIADYDGRVCFGSNTQLSGHRIPFIEGEGHITVCIDPIPLLRGKYFFSFSIHNEDHTVDFHRQENAYVIWIESEREEIGFIEMPTQWSTERSTHERTHL